MRGETQQLGEILEAMIGRLGIKRQLKRAEVVTAWEEIVGERIAGETHAEAVRGHTLFVRAESPVWAQELEFLKPEILKKIRARVGRGVVSDIRFRTGSAPAKK